MWECFTVLYVFIGCFYKTLWVVTLLENVYKSMLACSIKSSCFTLHHVEAGVWVTDRHWGIAIR